MTKNNFSAPGGSASGGKILFIFITAVFLTLGLSISFQSLLAAWTAPLAPPPTCASGDPGCDEPINKGTSSQIKSGSLWVNALLSDPTGTGFVAYGNVGIGTSSPSQKLEVVGAALIKPDATWSSGDVAKLYLGDTATYISNSYDDGTNPGTAFRMYWGMNVINQQGLVARFGTSFNSLNSYFTGNVGIGEVTPGSKLSVSGGGSFGSGYDTIAAPTNGLIIEGNVGIGTTEPAGKLHISGSAAAATLDARIVNTESSGAAGWRAYGDTANFVEYGSGGSTRGDILQDRGYMIDVGSDIVFSAFTAGKDIIFAAGGGLTTGTEKVRITSTGNVGIGTMSPVYKLTVNSSNNTDNLLQVATTTNQGIMVINNNGKVGIGTTTPDGQLTIVSPTPNRGTIEVFNVPVGGNNDIRFDGGNDSLFAFWNYGPDSNGATFFRSTTVDPILYLKNNGNVGIGTTTPGAKLDVVGQIKSTMARAQFSASSDWSIVSSGWVDTDVFVTTTTTGGPLLLIFNTQAITNTAGALIGLRFTIDGASVTNAAMGNAVVQNPPNTGAYQQTPAMTWLATGIAAGSHTIRVQVRVSPGATGYIGETSASEGSERTLIVIEL